MGRTDFGASESYKRMSTKVGRSIELFANINESKKVSSADSTHDEDDDNLMWNNNGGTGDLLLDFEAKNAIIHVSKDGRFDRYLFDIFVSLESKEDEKMIIEIYKRKDLSQLLQDIREALEIKYEELKGL